MPTPSTTVTETRSVTPAGASAPADRYEMVRDLTERLASPLGPEDQTVQTMPDVSPTKWHRAHTTWFFETFLLAPHLTGHTNHDDDYGFLFNSYYEAVGARHVRAERGHITRPTCEQVAAYRAAVDRQVVDLLVGSPSEEVFALVELGLHHEQQHQELLLMDIQHVLSSNPTRPCYHDRPATSGDRPAPAAWIDRPGGVHQIGHDGPGFHYDNEGPRHEALLRPHRLADRLVTNDEWRSFMADGGYDRPELWLSDGWARVSAEGWRAPLYWVEVDGTWYEHGLPGFHPVDPARPVVHVSHYEADAYARWAGARLPSEQEWEAALADQPVLPRPFDADDVHPRAVDRQTADNGVRQAFGEVWQWTSSPYVGYPGYHPPAGAIGEYNGKFMSGQIVLRGSSCATPPGHARATYRNFFPPGARWAFAGVRLADDG